MVIMQYDISFLGYETIRKEVYVRGKAVLNIQLVPLLYNAGEVIVNAIRAGDRAPLAYSTIDEELIRKNNTGQDIPFPARNDSFTG